MLSGSFVFETVSETVSGFAFESDMRIRYGRSHPAKFGIRERDRQDERQRVGDRLGDLHAQQPQEPGQDQDQRDEEQPAPG